MSTFANTLLCVAICGLVAILAVLGMIVFNILRPVPYKPIREEW